MNQAEMLTRFAREGDFDCFLLAGRYTLLDQIGLLELLPLCEEKQISIVLGGPYNSGILASSHKNDSHYNYELASPEILEKAKKLESLCETHGVSLKAAALQFPLAHPAVASVIPGARNLEQLEENIQLISVDIPKEFWLALRQSNLIASDAPIPE